MTNVLGGYSNRSFALAPARADGSQRLIPSLAGRYDKYIQPDQQAPGLTIHDKVVLGFKEAFSPSSIAVWALVGGYEQATDGSPNWPQNKAGYFRRAGAAGVRDGTDEIFADAVFAPLFHQDPRYYKLGRRYGVVYRAFYALSRPIVTLTDDGHRAFNVSLIAGTFCGSLMTNIYYPVIDQGIRGTAQTFGGSMGSAALGYFIAEFTDDVLEALHLERRR